MELKACLAALGKGQVDGGYIFYGEEEYLKEQALNQVRKVLLAPGMEMMDEQVVEDMAPSVRDLKAMTGMPPFMSQRRLVVVKDDPRFRVRRKAGEEAEEEEAETPAKVGKNEIKDLGAHLGELSTLVFYNRGEMPSSAWLKQLSAVMTAVEFKPLASADAAPWIRRMARQAGVTMEEGTAEFLFEYVGGLLKPVETELAKLAAYCSGRAAQRADVEAVCVPSVEYKVFAMIDQLLTGQSEKALASYYLMIGAGEPPFRLLALIASQLRVRARAGEAAAARMTAAEVADALGVKPFVAEKALRQAGRGGADFGAALSLCADADYAFKTGRLSEENAVEQAVLNLAHLLSR